MPRPPETPQSGPWADLARDCETILADAIPAGLAAGIRRAVAAGRTKREVMATIYRVAGHRSLVTLAASAWCDRMLREYA